MLKKIIASIVLVFVLLGATFTASAVGENYIKVDVPGNDHEHRLAREMYEATDKLLASTLGLEEEFKGMTDIFYSDSNDILLLCGGESRLVKISKNYSKASEVNVVDKDGNEITFKGAEGVYSDDAGNIYISDTENERVLILNKKGVLKTIINRPVSELIPEDFQFQPTSIAKDTHGYTYILSKGCYYGALMYTPEYEFMGFYGPNTVKSSALDTLSYLWDKLTSTDAKKDYSGRKLPYSFTDFTFDTQGFMITCTAATNRETFVVQNETGQIKKISHNGANILYKRTLKGEIESSSTINFTEPRVEWGAAGQSIDSIVSSPDEYIFALETGHGIISIYDAECNLMSAFGGGIGIGDQLGLFSKPIAITLNGNNDILVADNGDYSITVFKSTEYGDLIRKAQGYYLKGDYDDAADLWAKVLAKNRNCQLAYRGLAMVYYNQGEYNKALEAAEIACDYSVYDLVWNEMVSNFVAKYFAVIVFSILAIVIAVWFIARKIKKSEKKITVNRKLKLLFEVPFHPFNSFDELRYKDMGSVPIAIVLLILFYIASVLNVTANGFLYSNTLLRNYNSLYTIFSTIGLVLLWSVCNWLVCSMFEGKGSFKHVFVATTYCTMPWVLFLFLKVILTNVLPLATAGLISGIETVVLIYTFFMLAIALIKIHDFDFFKVLLTTIVIVFFMILVIFVILMCGILAEQFISFIGEIIEEIIYK
ncbi:MAG: YIP1 family protein [Clostridia bacterium]|nr:YIP1 family protein [Clostridia bacterium]